jgi:hypothetical protein
VGVGERKLADYGDVFIAEIQNFLKDNPRQKFAESEAPAKKTVVAATNDTQEETLRLYRDGQTPEQIAKSRALSLGTITKHLLQGISNGEKFDLNRILTGEQQAAIAAVFAQEGFLALGPVFGKLKEQYSFDVLRLFRAVKQQEGVAPPSEAVSEHYRERMEAIRAEKPQAYAPWTPEAEAQLRELHAQGLDIEVICERIQRQRGGVMSRLKKLGLLES